MQFTSSAPNRSTETTAQVVKEQPAVAETAPAAEEQSAVTVEPVVEVVEEVMAEAVAEPIVTETVIAETPEEAVVEASAETVVETIVEAEEAEGEEVEDEAPAVSSAVHAYTSDMPVEEICSMMTYEEACNVIVPTGTCKDWTLAQVADRRPASLKWYISGYQGNDNILRAAATIMQSTLEVQKAS